MRHLSNPMPEDASVGPRFVDGTYPARPAQEAVLMKNV